MKKSRAEFLKEYRLAYTDLEESKKFRPMTLEGCVVRISDIIGYIGRDIEDAITLGLLKREDIPEDIVKVLGNNNKDIINNIILDIIKNSLNKPYIKLSKDVFKAVFELKKFNNEHIYLKSMSSKDYEYYNTGMNKIYNRYLQDIDNKNMDSSIMIFLNSQSKKYLKETNVKRQVIDFIAGMTDEMFLREINLYK